MDHFDAVHIPKLKSPEICPFVVTKELIRHLKLNMQDPLFQTVDKGVKYQLQLYR